MTYRYCMLACGRNLPFRGIDWSAINEAVPCDLDGNEINPATPYEAMMLWEKKVDSYSVVGNIIYCRLKVR